MLIDCSYFTKGSRHIQNATIGTVPNPNAVEVNAAIGAYIRENQERFLVRMLGERFGSRMNEYLVRLEEDENPRHNAKFDEVLSHLRESFADYVLFYILRDSNTQSTITGLVRLKNSNEYIAPISRQVRVWNSMVDKNRAFARWCKANIRRSYVDEDMLTRINIFNL